MNELDRTLFEGTCYGGPLDNSRVKVRTSTFVAVNTFTNSIYKYEQDSDYSFRWDAVTVNIDQLSKYQKDGNCDIVSI